MPRFIWPVVVSVLLGAAALGAWATSRPAISNEAELRSTLDVAPSLEVRYRDVDCNRVSFTEYARGVRAWRAFTSRAFDPAGSSLTLTVARKGHARCPFPYPRVTSMPALDAEDLAGSRVTSAGLRGRPTVVAFFFATCPTCRRDVAPLNALAARHPELNLLAVTYETPAVAGAFAREHGLRWRVVPDEAAFIRRAGVYVYPTVILFAPDGRVVARMTGGVKASRDAASAERGLEEGLEHWLTQALGRG